MARIIYKNGCENKNRLECIEGLEIDLLNGQKALIYPKYSEEAFMESSDRDRWFDAGISETAALRLRDNQAATAALLATRGADWDIRMRRLDDADLERERRIFGAS